MNNPGRLGVASNALTDVTLRISYVWTPLMTLLISEQI